LNHGPGEKAPSLKCLKERGGRRRQQMRACVGSVGPRTWPCSGVPEQIRRRGQFAGTSFNIHALLHHCLHVNKPFQGLLRALTGWRPSTSSHPFYPMGLMCSLLNGRGGGAGERGRAPSAIAHAHVRTFVFDPSLPSSLPPFLSKRPAPQIHKGASCCLPASMRCSRICVSRA